MQPEQIVEIAEAQYQLLKSTVLKELALPFTQDETTGMIMETFPGSTVVASTGGEAPRAAAQRRQSAPAAQSAPAPRQASTGQRGGQGTASRSRSSQTPSQAEMWQELLDFPGDWYWQSPESKRSEGQPDYLSTKYFQDNGYPVGLWEWNSRSNQSNCPDPDFLNTIPAEAFAQQRPTRRQ
jgi:hypothetical protein